ncbi:MAG: HAD family hydrolase [Bacteroidales bacterium]|nr:HAD family hydrolase [Bacteroidales bacterium]
MNSDSHQKESPSLIDDYDLFIFDLDGTLYNQRKLRNIMTAALISRWLTFRVKRRDLQIILCFRRLREEHLGHASKDLEREQYGWCAEALDIEAGQVRSVIKKWMLSFPLSHLRKVRYPGIKSFFHELKKHQKKIAVFSDFPVDDKLKSLHLEADRTFCSTDQEIAQLKPSKRGVEIICRSFGCPPARTIFFGDRTDTDGESARLAGVHFRLIDVKLAQKGQYYRKLLQEIKN